jgi:hypothetical protein
VELFESAYDEHARHARRLSIYYANIGLKKTGDAK